LGAKAKVKMNSRVTLIQLPRSKSEAAVASQADPGYMSEGYASWYAYKNCDCAASPDFPKGSYVKVTRTNDPTKSVVVRINDFGPVRAIHPDRVIDLDKVAFQKIAPLGAGLTHVTVEPVEAPPILQTPVVVQNPAPKPVDTSWSY
jgi:rare lipoprotein A